MTDIDTLRKRLAAVDAEYVRLNGRGSTDPASVNLPLRTRLTDAYVQRMAQLVRQRESLIRQIAVAEAPPVPPRKQLTAADVKGATRVRVMGRWFDVVRVNAKSVTVTTSYGTDRWTFTEIDGLDKSEAA